MTYVLIIVIWFSGYARGYVVTTQEFSSLTACEAARDFVVRSVRDGHDYKITCVQK